MKPHRKCIRVFLVAVFSLAGLCLLAPQTRAEIQDGDFESGPGIWTEDSSQALLPLVIETNLISLPPIAAVGGPGCAGRPMKSLPSASRWPCRCNRPS